MSPSLDRVRAVRVHAVCVPRVYRTRVADGGPGGGKARSRYYVLELEDGDGVVGLGEVSDLEEAWSAPAPADLAAALEAVLVGADPLRRHDLLDRISASVCADLHPELGRLVRAAVETALLDLTARRAGLPVCELLGGRCRDRVPVTWVAYIRGTAELEGEVSERVAQGFAAFKLKVGADFDLDCERVALARRFAGDAAHLRLDASGAWQPEEARACIRRFAELGADAVETPLACASRSLAKDRPGALEADGAAAELARLRAAVPIPLIEHVADFDDAFAVALVARRAVDAFNVVPVQAGGLLRSLRLLHLAQTAGIDALLGSTVELGIGTAAALHLAAAAPAVRRASDLVGPGLLAADVVGPPLRYDAGHLAVPVGPGLGVDLDPCRLAPGWFGGE